MKKLNEALGYLDEAFLDEAEAGIRRPRVRRSALLAAALAVMLAIGIAAVGIRYFAPGVGIVYDSSVRVLAAMEKVQLGDVEIDTVMMTDMGDGTGTLSVWVYRAKEVAVDLENAIKGIPPKELEDFACIVDGVEYEHTKSSMSTVGFSQYMFEHVPLCETLMLKNGEHTSEIMLHEIDPKECGGTIRHGNSALTLFPVSDSENIWVMEYHDELAQKLAQDASSYTIHAILRTIRDDGESGALSGYALLDGGNDFEVRSADVGLNDYDKGVVKAALKSINLMFSFNPTCDIPELVLTVPQKGETVAYDLEIYNANGIEIRLKSMTYSENGIVCETECINNTKREGMVIGYSEVDLYVKRDIAYQNGIHWIEKKDAYTNVYNTSANHEKGAFIYDFDNDTDIELVGGEEVVLRLRELYYTISGYDESDNWFFNFDGNLGEIIFH